MNYFKRYYPVYLAIIGTFTCIALFMTNAITTAVDNLPLPRSAVLVIDPGHGGEDGGATSCTGALESQINLEISLRLNDLLHFMGYETVMIRDSDKAVYTPGTETITAKKVSDLKNRVATVNATANALLLSIHQNQFPEGKYSGAQVFYAETEGSQLLAEAMQQQLIRTLNPGSNREVKKAESVYLMKHINCTAVLVECGFLSNAEEEAKLRTEEYQKKLCCVIAAVTSQYLSQTADAV